MAQQLDPAAATRACYRCRNLSTRQWEFQKVQSAMYHLSERSDATIAELAAVLIQSRIRQRWRKASFSSFRKMKGAFF